MTYDTRRIANEFSKLVQMSLTPNELQTVLTRNRTLYHGDVCCATHDFVDANELMLAAFIMAGYTDELDLLSDPVLNARDNAWTIAKSAEFQVVSA